MPEKGACMCWSRAGCGQHAEAADMKWFGCAIGFGHGPCAGPGWYALGLGQKKLAVCTEPVPINMQRRQCTGIAHRLKRIPQPVRTRSTSARKVVDCKRKGAA